jgi:hypothetical protein
MTLIFGISYIGSEERAWLTRQWCHVVSLLNPDCHILAVHTASPDRPFPRHEAVEVFEFPDNLGHLVGFGRAFTYGLLEAVRRGYRRIVHVECDLLFLSPVAPTLDAMTKPILFVQARPHQVPETGLMFFKPPDAEWMHRFASAYDWRNAGPAHLEHSDRLPEVVFQKATIGEYQMKDFLGCRSEDMPRPLAVGAAAGLDWLTHATRPHYEAMMRHVGIEPVP